MIGLQLCINEIKIIAYSFYLLVLQFLKLKKIIEKLIIWYDIKLILLALLVLLINVVAIYYLF